tara:strand:- start:457 stop:1155 length:699 start_codon:yes stop_codon:yes gene_type:complete
VADSQLKLIQPASKRGLMSRLRNYFFTGVLVSAPFGLTAWLIWLLVDFVDRTVIPLIPQDYNPSNILGHSIPGLGVIIVLLVLTTIGALVTNFLGRYMLQIGERLLNRLPVIRTLYGLFKQIFDAVLAQSANAFREVVLIEYPRKGIWVIGFITGPTRGEIKNISDDEMVNVFIPTTPNPTSGFLLFLPRKDCTLLNMSVEQGVKMVISGGIVTPPDTKNSDSKPSFNHSTE